MQQITVLEKLTWLKTDSLYVRTGEFPTLGIFSSSRKSDILNQLIMLVNLN